MRAEGGKKEREKEEKRKGKRRNNWGSKLFFFSFYKSVRMFFSYAQWSFFINIRKTVSRLCRSYPPLFAIKIVMVSEFGDL